MAETISISVEYAHVMLHAVTNISPALFNFRSILHKAHSFRAICITRPGPISRTPITRLNTPPIATFAKPTPAYPNLFRRHFSTPSSSSSSSSRSYKYTFSRMPRENKGGRGRRDEGGRGGQGGDVVISKSLSFTLRHGAIKECLPIRPDGYANVQDLLDMPKFRRLNLTFDTLQRLVQESDKQRYQLATIDPEGNPVPIPLKNKTKSVETSTSTTTTSTGNSTTTSDLAITTSTPTLNPSFANTPSSYLIRATQGHSIPLSSTDLQLTPIATTNLPPHCIHGTFYPFLDPILVSGGLKAMGRNHIHFAPNLPQNSTVISGMRRDADLLFYIDLPKALAAGIPFWRSENEVILSEGDAEQGGLLGMEYVEKIVDIGSAGLGVIWEQGNGMIKELPEKLRNKGVPRGKERVIKHMGGRGGRGGRGQRGGGGQSGGSRVEAQDNGEA